MTEIAIRRFVGPEINTYITALAKLRIEVFRDYPYLYDGTMAYETSYLETYSNAPESLFVVVFVDDQVVGVSTGVPMEQETAEFKQPFIDHGYDPTKIFYFGESVLKQAYRGQGLGVKFFQEREAYAQSLKRFDYTTFCAVDRPLDHPRRPADYIPLDQFWANRGYEKRPELQTYYSWRDLDEQTDSPKPMTFWMKTL